MFSGQNVTTRFDSNLVWTSTKCEGGVDDAETPTPKPTPAPTARPVPSPTAASCHGEGSRSRLLFSKEVQIQTDTAACCWLDSVGQIWFSNNAALQQRVYVVLRLTFFVLDL